MKTTKSVIISVLALVFFSTLAAKAIIQNNQQLFNTGGSSTNGIQVDFSTANQGVAISNGKRNTSANGSFGGGLMLIDQTAASITRKSIVNENGVLFQMDNGGNLLKILLSTDLDSYSPNILGQQLDGFGAHLSYENINAFTPILDAFEILVGNVGLIKNGGVALASARITGGTAANDVILKTDNNKNLQVQLGVPGVTANVLTTADLSPAASKLLEVNGKTLNTTNTTAAFNVAAISGSAYFAKIANYSPDIIVKRQTATQIQIINGATVVTVNSGNTNVPIPGTNLQVDSFNGTQIVFEKASSTGLNAKDADIVFHYYGQ